MASMNNVPKEILDSMRECMDKGIKLSIKRLVNYETRKDKIENRVLAFSSYRLFIFTAKSPKDVKLESSIHYLDIKGIESKRPNHLVLSTPSRSYTFTALESDTDEINHMITHIGTSLKTVFPAYPLERLIKKLEVEPPDRLNFLNDQVHTIQQKERGPCEGFTLMYASMCDYHSLPYRDEVAWDVDTIYLSQECKELSLRDFDHLKERDLVPIISALVYNTWFTSLNANNVKLSADACNEILHIMKKNTVIEALLLSNTGISTEFIKKLSTISMSGTQLHKLDLSNNAIDDIGAEHLFGTLSSRGRRFTWLDLSKTKVTSKGLNRISEAMSKSPHVFTSLQTLILNGLTSGNKVEDLQNLYTFLASPSMITHLDLSGTDVELERLMAPLQRGCSQNLTTLKLARTVFSHKKSKEVVIQPSFKQFFSSVYALKQIDLSGVKLPPEALKDLLTGLDANRNLKDIELDISGIDLAGNGAQYLQNCLSKNIVSLNISNIAFTDTDLINVLQSIGQGKHVRQLSVGRVFQNLKARNLKNVLEAVVNIVQDEESVIESLSLADSKLKDCMNMIVNALGSNTSLTEIDISGNSMGDLGAKMLSKALQINNKLKTILWDHNNTSCQGFEDVAGALEKNYTLKKMPMPVFDASVALRTNPEKTEQALQTIERLLQRNHSPQKYSSDQAYRLQQGFLISSTQQMVDRLVVQSEDTINALTAMDAADTYSEDIKTTQAIIRDADNSKTLLPRLHDIAIKSQNSNSPVGQKLKEVAKELTAVLEAQMMKTVEEMLEDTSKQCKTLMKEEGFSSDLKKGCTEKSALPKDFTSNVLNDVDTDIFNQLSELNLAVAAHVSDRIIDEVIERLSHSHKMLTNHLNECKKGAGRRSQITKSQKMEDNEANLRTKEGSSPMDSPKIKEKRQSMHARKIRPQSTVGELDGEPQLSLPTKPKTKETDINLDNVPELTEGATKLSHMTKDRARRFKNVRPMTRQSDVTGPMSADSMKVDENIEEFFTKPSTTAVVSHSKKGDSKSPSAKSTPESKKKFKGLFRFGSKDKENKENEGNKKQPLVPKIGGSAKSPKLTEKARVSDVVEEPEEPVANNILTESTTENSSLKTSSERQSEDIIEGESKITKSASENDSLITSLEKKFKKTDSLGRISNKSDSLDGKSEKSDSLERKSDKSDSLDRKSNKSINLDSKSESSSVSASDSDTKGHKESKEVEESQSEESEKSDTDETAEQETKSDKVKETDSGTKKEPLKPPIVKRSVSKGDKEEPKADVVEESKDTAPAEVKNEDVNETNVPEKQEDGKEKTEDTVSAEPLRPKKPVGGMGFNVDLKAIQEKRRSMMPTKLPADKPSNDKPSGEENKLPFGVGILKPVSKTKPSPESDSDSTKSSKPVKPDNKGSDAVKSRELAEKKAGKLGSDKGDNLHKAENGEEKLEKQDSSKESDKPAHVLRPAGLSKPLPPSRPKPTPPSNKPTPAPRRSLGSIDGDQDESSGETSKPVKHPDRGGVVYDSATLKLSVKDKIAKLTEDEASKGKPLLHSESPKGKQLTHTEKLESLFKQEESRSKETDASELDSSKAAEENRTEVAKESDILRSKEEGKTGEPDLQKVEESSEMTDSGIDVDTPRSSFKDASSKFGGVGQKTASLPRNTNNLDVKKDSPRTSRRPHSMLAVIEKNPDLKKQDDTKPEIPEEKLAEDKVDGEGVKDQKSPTEEVILV